MNKGDYKRLGDYIREVDVRNTDLKISKLYGVNLSKEFMPSVANTIGTDMSRYKLVSYNQFGCKLMSVERDHKMPISLMKEKEPAILSSAYYVFKVVDECVLLPDYLFMQFKSPEFDRRLWFSTGGDVRGGATWENLCDMPIHVPAINEQKRIVDRYKAIQNRIEINKQTISRLEEAAQALYRKMFVNDIDVENLPEGWRMGTIKEFCKEMKSGGTPSRSNSSYWDSKDIPWLKSGEVHNNVIWKTEDYISKAGLENSSAKLIPKDSVVMAMYGATAAQVVYLNCETTTNQACCNMICNSKEDAAFLYFHLRYYQEEIKKLANGGAQENLSQELIASQPILIGTVTNSFYKLIKLISLKTKEIEKLTELQSILLSKINY